MTVRFFVFFSFLQSDFRFQGVLISMKNTKTRGIPVWALLLTTIAAAAVLIHGGLQKAESRFAKSPAAQSMKSEELSQASFDSLTELEALDIRIAEAEKDCHNQLTRLQEEESKGEKIHEEKQRLNQQSALFLIGYQKGQLSLKEMARMEDLSELLKEKTEEAKKVEMRIAWFKEEYEKKKDSLNVLLQKRNLLWQERLLEQHEQAETDFKEGGAPESAALIDLNSLWADKGTLKDSGGMNDEQDAKKACLAYALNEIDGTAQLSASDGWVIPAAGSVSAGTWAYPSGSMHLGMDLAVPLFTPLKAPADGLILYADAPVESTGGYLGNWSGWPQGGGNTLAMAVNVRGKLYAVTFAHLSASLRVKPGQTIKQSDIIALSGNSGNSTGPHTHIEVFEIHVSLQELVSFFSRNADFSFGCGFSQPGSSLIGTRIRPEELFFA